MKGIVKNVFEAIVAITCLLYIGINPVGFHAKSSFADNNDAGTQRNDSIKAETEAKLDIATRFNVEVEDIDSEDIFSKPSFGKAYHKSGFVKDYRKAIKPDELPDYQLRRADHQNGSKHLTWSTATFGILCLLLLVFALIIFGVSLFFRNSSKPDFKCCN